MSDDVLSDERIGMLKQQASQDLYSVNETTLAALIDFYRARATPKEPYQPEFGGPGPDGAGEVIQMGELPGSKGPHFDVRYPLTPEMLARFGRR